MSELTRRIAAAIAGANSESGQRISASGGWGTKEWAREWVARWQKSPSIREGASQEVKETVFQILVASWWEKITSPRNLRRCRAPFGYFRVFLFPLIDWVAVVHNNSGSGEGNVEDEGDVCLLVEETLSKGTDPARAQWLKWLMWRVREIETVVYGKHVPWFSREKEEAVFDGFRERNKRRIF